MQLNANHYDLPLRDYMLAHGTGDQLDATDLGTWIASWWVVGFDSTPVLYAALAQAEVPPATIRAAFARAGLQVPVRSVIMNYADTPGFKVWSLLATLSSGVGIYHGYKRHQNEAHPVAWALWWGFLGGLFPVAVPVLSLAQGISKPLPLKEA